MDPEIENLHSKFDIIFAEELGFGVFSKKENQTLFVSVLPPARNIITMETREVSSQIDCAYMCLNSDSCCYFVYASDSNKCTIKKLE